MRKLSLSLMGDSTLLSDNPFNPSPETALGLVPIYQEIRRQRQRALYRCSDPAVGVGWGDRFTSRLVWSLDR